MKVLPEPGSHRTPPSVLYSQTAPVSKPSMSSRPSLLMPSTDERPVSFFRFKLGATGADMSMTTVLGFCIGSLVLPAASICCTRIAALT